MSSITQINKPYVQVVHNGDPNISSRQYKICFCTRTVETSSSNTVFVKPPAAFDVNNNFIILVELTTTAGLADPDSPVATLGGYRHHFQFIEYDVRGDRNAIFVLVKDLSGNIKKTKINYEDAEEASDGGDLS